MTDERESTPVTVDLRHHVRSHHLDRAEIRAALPRGAPTMHPHSSPMRAANESLESWAHRIHIDYMDRRLETLAHYHGED